MAAPTAVPFPARGVRARAPLPVVAAVVAALLAVAVVVATRGGDGASSSLAGSVAPAFALDDVRSPGMPVTLGAPGKPVVLNFFASWCVPCRDELPLLERASRVSGDDVSFVGVDVNDSRKGATAMLDEAGVTFPTGYDPDRSVATRYRLRGMPTTVFVDARGRVAEVAHGRLTAADLDRRLARLTGGS
jgi:cytochrome c biogenesis protein CcmG/thiol:disulfide interchange protein DsbE